MRMEASVDSTTRFFHLIAEVEQPFNTQMHSQVLPMGLFVNARIPGKLFDNSLRIPEKAVFNNQVFVVGEGNTLSLKPITIINREGEFLWVQAAIDSGTSVVVSDPRVLRESMAVTIDSEPPTAAVLQ